MIANTHHKPTVFLLESADASRQSPIAQSLASFNFEVEYFRRGEDFLSRVPSVLAGCVVCQLRLEDISGIEIQQRLNEIGSLLPLVMFAERASTQLIVRTMKNGAVSFLNSPANVDELWLAVSEALTENARRIKAAEDSERLCKRFDPLTESELAVLTRMKEGYSNKQIASELDVSVRTVESRKSRLLRKTQSKSVPEVLVAFHQYCGTKTARDSSRNNVGWSVTVEDKTWTSH